MICDLTMTVSYLISMSLEFAATISNVNGIFRHRRRPVLKFKADIVSPVAWKKVSISTYIVNGDNTCCRTTMCAEKTGINLRRRQYM